MTLFVKHLVWFGSFPFGTFRSFPFFKRNVLFFSVPFARKSNERIPSPDHMNEGTKWVRILELTMGNKCHDAVPIVQKGMTIFNISKS